MTPARDRSEEVTVAWRELVREAVDRLSRAGVASPGVDARRIVESSAGLDTSEYHQALDEPATVRGVATFDSLLARREAGEPLQYVVGRWGFRMLDLHVDARVLIPRPETEVVAGLVVAEVQRRSDDLDEVTVADLGTGSGAIGLAVAHECPRAHVIATDVSSDALAVARANLAGLGRAATRVTLAQGSWFDALEPSMRGSLDVIVANPPYIAAEAELPDLVAEWEPSIALRAGPSGTEAIETLLAGVGVWLRPDGVFVVELAPAQVDSMGARAAELGFGVAVHVDLAGRERALVLSR